MPIRQIRQIGDEILTKKSKDVTIMDDRTKSLIKDMEDTMNEFEGCGIAAVQVGVLKNIIIVKPEIDGETYLFINPTITEKSDTENIDFEGCLSVEGKRGQVKRPDKITISAKDINLKPFTLTAEGFFARAICHEFDHLNGILYVDKLESKLYNIDELEITENKIS